MIEKTLNLKKRDCDIEMRIAPYGSGWTDVYLNIGADNHHFIISNVMGEQFEDLLFALYHLNPNINDAENAYHKMEYKNVNQDELADKSPFSLDKIPWKISFRWDEEGSWSNWTFERDLSCDNDFLLKIHIEHCREEKTNVYSYEVLYKDFCYSVSKAYTEMLKKHGFLGYHYSTQYQDIDIRHLLYLKAVALDNFEAIEITNSKESECGDKTNIDKELELLLFEM